jgi:hypothetical protein
MHECIDAQCADVISYNNSNTCLSDSKLAVDAIRAQLWLLADHSRQGIEVPAELLEAMLFRIDRDLASVSDAIVSELCKGGRV